MTYDPTEMYRRLSELRDARFDSAANPDLNNVLGLLRAADEAVRASEARLRAATAANPMARLAAGLTTDAQLDRVRSIVALSLGAAFTTSLLAFLAHLEPRPYRREGGALKRAVRAFLARRKRLRVIERPIFKTKTILKYVPVGRDGRPLHVVSGGKQ